MCMHRARSCMAGFHQVHGMQRVSVASRVFVRTRVQGWVQCSLDLHVGLVSSGR